MSILVSLDEENKNNKKTKISTLIIYLTLSTIIFCILIIVSLLFIKYTTIK